MATRIEVEKHLELSNRQIGSFIADGELPGAKDKASSDAEACSTKLSIAPSFASANSFISGANAPSNASVLVGSHPKTGAQTFLDD